MSQAHFALARRHAIGTWRLHPGQAMGLRPRRESLLRIYCGRVWVTQGGPYMVDGRELGDRFLSPGDTLRVPAGVHLVMEPLVDAGDEAPVHFDWTVASTLETPSRFEREVLSPSRELGAALRQALTAMARVLRGLLGYSEFLVAGRGRVLSPLESLRS